MKYDRRYVQFNDLVFDEYDMISDYDAEVAFKTNTQEYSHGHGSYMPLKSDYMWVKSQSISMTITLHLKKIPCEYREFYVQFAQGELSRPGRLWAVQNNAVVWAYAVPVNMSHVLPARHDEVTYDVEFMAYEGVWHKADKLRTFMLPYNTCLFMECKGYQHYDPCASSVGTDCCIACMESKDFKEQTEQCYCCCVDEITPEMALCFHQNDLQRFYDCEVPFQLVYSCEYAAKFNREEYMGQKLCVKDLCDESVIAGRFYSDTDLQTDDVIITITGRVKNPWITINGNTNIIKGEYDGALTIQPSGDVYYRESECCEPVLLSPSVWEIPCNMDYGWKVNPRWNTIKINLNQCCGLTCVYIDADAITA